jgi:hypothetical protein
MAYDPRLIFTTGEQFFQAAQLLQKSAGNDPVRQYPLVVPVTTYNALSLEIFLKCLATINSP